jgi:hypothetical protein
VIREFTSAADPDRPRPDAKEPRIRTDPGIGRFVWDLRHRPATRLEGDFSVEAFANGLAGPQVLPGRYTARLTVAGKSVTKTFEVRMDPRVGTDTHQLREQFDLLLRLRDKISHTHEAVQTIRDVRTQLELWERRSMGRRPRGASSLIARLRERLLAIEEELIQWRAKNRGASNWPTQLNAKLCALAAAVAQADAQPTAAQAAVFEDLARRVDAQFAKLDELLRTDVERFNALARSSIVTRNSGAPRRRRRG